MKNREAQRKKWFNDDGRSWLKKKAIASDSFALLGVCRSPLDLHHFAIYNVIDTLNAYLGNDLSTNNALEWKNE